MKRRSVAKSFRASAAKQLACLSIAASVVATPLTAFADTPTAESAENMAPVSATSESEVLNVLVPQQTTSSDPELIASPKAVYTDISGKPAAGSAEATKADAEKTEAKTEANTEAKTEAKTEATKPAVKKADAQKGEGRMAKLRKMASRVRVGREKKAIASADIPAVETKKAETSEAAKTDEVKTEAVETPTTAEASAPSSQGWNEGESKATENKTEVKATEASSENKTADAATAEVAPAETKSADASTEKAAEATGDASTAVSVDAADAKVTDVAEASEDANDEKGEGAAIAFGLPGTLNDLQKASKLSPDGIIVVDNDEAVEQNDHLEYEDMPLDEGKTKIKIGARFPVVISSAINSKTAKKGDRFEARLKYDLKIGDKLVAKKGSIVRGHLDYCLKARTILHSLVSPERWYRNSGCIGLAFDEIVNENGEHIPCVAAPARAGRVIKNKAEGRELGVNHNGQVVGPWAQQLRYKAVRVGLNFAMAPAGVFSFGAMPVALGAIGAVNPNFAFGKPVGLNVRHRRIKGFAWGFLSGIPGSWLIEDTTVKGQEAVIKPGDEFYAAFRQEFNGEPETDASLMAGGSTKVRGQVIKEPDTAAKKK